MDVLRPRWIATIAFSLSIGGCLAYYLCDASAAANFSSIWGLAVSLIGFAITISTMLQTQRIAREAQEKIQKAAERSEKAVADAYRQASAAMERVATVLLVSEVDQFLRHIH